MSDQHFIPATNPGSGTRPRVVLDTDTYNEIDDQFAVAYLLRAEDVLRPEALYAAPFHNNRSTSPGDGMEKSYEEIGRLLSRLDREDFPSYRGSTRLLPDGHTPVTSEAAANLVERAMSATHSDRLAVVAIGALTNVASAILLEPSIIDRITVVWLGGHGYGYPHNREFNLMGDVTAVRVVYDSNAPLYVMPAIPVSSHMQTTREELSRRLDLDDPLSRFLYERFDEYGPKDCVWSKVIWDVAAVAWLVLPGSIESMVVPTPRVADDGSYIADPLRPPCRFAYLVDRDAVFSDLFARLR